MSKSTVFPYADFMRQQVAVKNDGSAIEALDIRNRAWQSFQYVDEAFKAIEDQISSISSLTTVPISSFYNSATDNGTYDNAIQRAQAYADSHGDFVLTFGPTSYTFSNRLSLYRKVLWQGVSMQTKLVWHTTGNAGLYLPATCQESQFKDLQIQGPGWHAASPDDGLWLGASRCGFWNCVFWEWSNTGIRIDADVNVGSNANINYFYNFRASLCGTGIYTKSGDSNANCFFGGFIGDCTIGVDEQSFLGNFYYGVTVEGCYTRGYRTSNNSGNKTVFAGCYCESNSPMEIYSPTLWVGGVAADNSNASSNPGVILSGGVFEQHAHSRRSYEFGALLLGKAFIASNFTGGESIRIIADGGSPVTIVFTSADQSPSQVAAKINASMGYSCAVSRDGLCVDLYGITSTISVSDVVSGSLSKIGHSARSSSTNYQAPGVPTTMHFDVLAFDKTAISLSTTNTQTGAQIQPPHHVRFDPWYAHSWWAINYAGLDSADVFMWKDKFGWFPNDLWRGPGDSTRVRDIYGSSTSPPASPGDSGSWRRGDTYTTMNPSAGQADSWRVVSVDGQGVPTWKVRTTMGA